MVVILKYLGVIYLWGPQIMTNCVTPNTLHLQKLTINLLSKANKIWRHLTNIWTLHPHHFYADVINIWSLTCLLWYDFFFSVLEKISILLFERNKPIIKILFKDTFELCNCGSSVKVNRISDSTLWIFVWKNANNAYCNKEETAINMQNLA